MAEKNTYFKVLSHACLLVKRGQTALVIDPWLSGSCYWRSWWNYPEPKIDEDELKSVSHVMISHIHWDHWHGLTLKKYFKNCHFIIPDEPKTRSYDDLARLKLGEVSSINHGQTIVLRDDIKITVYQFGLFLTDSAIVIETPEVKILNANDVKIVGWPLKNILQKHGHFDFALRSHSTANFRACISVENDTTQLVDDNEHYSRSFKFFMDAVKPTYAVPFASNHCHLHKDTFQFNSIITNPLRLKKWLDEHGQLAVSELKIMLPGSCWNSQTGFELSNLEPFEEVEKKIEQYQQKKSVVLENYYQQEAQQTLNANIILKHETHLKNIPTLFRKLVKHYLFAYKIVSNDQVLGYYLVDCHQGKILEIDESSYQNSIIKIIWPILIFKQAISLKMYAHAFISKRVRFVVKDSSYVRSLYLYLAFLEVTEHEFFPLRWKYLIRLVIAYCRRWREVFLYVFIFNESIIKKKALPVIEEILLQKSANK